ncbi:hypothetical protein D3C72_640910 [compost metagenome]
MVLGPMPWSSPMRIGARKLASEPGGTTQSPRGLFTLEATLATSLLVPAPTEQVSPVSARTSACSARAAASGVPMTASQPVMSR